MLPAFAGGEIIDLEGTQEEFKDCAFCFHRSFKLNNFTWKGDGVRGEGKGLGERVSNELP